MRVNKVGNEIKPTFIEHLYSYHNPQRLCVAAYILEARSL